MYFFLSYARLDNDKSFLSDFFTDLDKSIQQSLGITESAGFFDEEGLEPGDLWRSKLEEGLASCRVFVAAVSAGYSKSDYCGREWAAFESRVDAYSLGAGIKLPPLIIPLLWRPSAVPLPAQILDRQYTFGKPTDDHNTKGLVRLYKLKPDYEAQRTDYIDALAQHIIKLHDEHGAIAKFNGVPKLADTVSAFTSKKTQPVAPGAAPVKGPKRVHFVFGAGTSSEVKASRQNVDPYGSAGEEWRPFYPAAQTIESIALGAATQNGLTFYTGQLNFSGDLPTQIRQAETQRELVVMFVDSWTAGLPQYQRVLQDFDRQNYENCSVLVPWNDKDPENQNKKQDLMDVLQRVLRFRVRGQNDLYYRPPSGTEDDLRLQLVDVLTRLRADVINKSVPPPGLFEDGAGGRPIISGPQK